MHIHIYMCCTLFVHTYSSLHPHACAHPSIKTAPTSTPRDRHRWEGGGAKEGHVLVKTSLVVGVLQTCSHLGRDRGLEDGNATAVIGALIEHGGQGGVDGEQGPEDDLPWLYHPAIATSKQNATSRL